MPGMPVDSVSLGRLFPEAQLHSCHDIVAQSVTADSRLVRNGDVYAAIVGTQCDGHDHIPSAIRNGASAVVVARHIPDLEIPQCVVTCTATAYARLCMAINSVSPNDLTCAGVTGTNGKTTTTWILHSMLTAAGIKSGLLGTIQYSNGATSRPATLTTPSAEMLAVEFRSMLTSGASHCSMEVSSHALVQKRCAAVRFSAAAVTNVTHDHLDYHGTADSYLSAKGEIAGLLHADAPLLLNSGDNGCRLLGDRLPKSCRTILYGVGNPSAELRASVISTTHRSQRIRLHLAQGDLEVRIRLIGRHNVENTLAAAGLAEQLGIKLDAIRDGIESLQAVPGRLERIDEGQPFLVLVDYAHTPDALTRSIATIREFAPGRIICVLGAGGDRDSAKRPMMGRAATAADICVLTSDNPRSEDPEQIIDDVSRGIPAKRAMIRECNRTEAIRIAFQQAEAGDVVLIAGKGHESFQEVADGRLPFDDREVARQLLRADTLHHFGVSGTTGFRLVRPA